MTIYIWLIPLVATVLVTILKMKIIKTENSKKSVFQEFIIDFLKFIIVYFILILANIFLEIDSFKPSTMLIDFILMSVSLLVLPTKNYVYAERKAVLALVSSILISAILVITIFNMILGTYNSSHVTYAMLFIKLIISFAISMWGAFTAESVTFKDKLKSFFKTLIYSFKEYNMTKMDYHLISILLLFIFVGGPNNSFTPIGLFGLHEIARKKYIKGACYILSANIILALSASLIGQLLYLLYLLIAMIDLCWIFFNLKQINLQKKSL